MTKPQKIGLAVLLGLCALLGAAWLMRSGKHHAAKDSIFVRQRMINLRKGK